MTKFQEIARAQIGDNKYLVFSKNEQGKITLAQMLIFNENGREIPMFVKNAAVIEPAYFIDLIDAVEKVEDALNKI